MQLHRRDYLLKLPPYLPQKAKAIILIDYINLTEFIKETEIGKPAD